jgi:hypothetical protein
MERLRFTRRIIQRAEQQSGLVAASYEPDDFAPDGLFLVGKGETDESSSVEIDNGAGEHIKTVTSRK